MDKRTLFKLCLVALGKSFREWAEEQGVSDRAVYLVLDDRMTSERLSREVEATIEAAIPIIQDAIEHYAEAA